jgi:hypothetical protein
MTQAIANLSDVVLATAAAKNLKSAEGAGLKAVLIGAVFLKLRQDTKSNQNVLFNALAAETSEGSAANYVSRSRAAAMQEHFPWPVDPNVSLDVAVDNVMPEFRSYWRGSVNNIRRSGPNTPGRTRTVPTTARASPNDAAQSVLQHLVEIDSGALVALRAAIDLELSRRAEQIAQAA